MEICQRIQLIVWEFKTLEGGHSSYEKQLKQRPLANSVTV